jgi:hypothetical protein
MEAELNLNRKNSLYEIWADGKFIITIGRHKQEKINDYKARAESEFDNYVNNAKGLKATSSVVKKTTI